MRKPKVKVISRNEEEFTRERKTDVFRVQRNVDPSLHPFEKAREYTRTLNAVKMDKMYAMPFITALDGHSDGVFCMATHPHSLSTVLSGSCDGEIRVWNISAKKCIQAVPAHRGFVQGLCVSHTGETYLSCGSDSTIKQWSIDHNSMEENKEEIKPISTFYGNNAFTAIDHKRDGPIFATSGAQLHVWDESRSSPIATHSWGCDSIVTVRFNPIETDIVASSATDRSIVLYDLRGNTPIKRMVLSTKTNAIAWNPLEAFNFSIANEDYNCYTFDMRRMEHALNVHKDHVSAVMSIDYSPTGQEFVSGSYDRTLRIFPISSGHSREIYHTKRMQRIFSVKFTADARFVLSGSDDTNIRVWKAKASAPLKTLLPREREALEYREKLKERFAHLPQIRRIDRYRHLPRTVYKAKKLKVIMKNADDRRVKNRLLHSNASPDERREPERKKHIVTVDT